MATVICRNTLCKHISKRRTKFENGNKEKVMHYTCKSAYINIIPALTGNCDEEEIFGYVPMECMNSSTRDF